MSNSNIAISDKPASGPTRPYDPEVFAENPELAPPRIIKQAGSAAAKAAVERGAEMRRRARLDEWPVPCPPGTAGIFGKIADMCPDSFISPENFKEWQAARKTYDRLNITIGEVVPEKARHQYVADRAALEKAMADGTHTQNNPKDSWSQDDYREDFANRMKAAKAARKIVVQKASDIVAPVLLRIADWAEEVATNVENSERPDWVRFELPYVESGLVTTIRAAAQRLRNPTWPLNPFSEIAGKLVEITGAKLK